MLCISPENGFCELQTDSVSSKVLVKDGFIYKINDRNSLARQQSDLKTLHERLAEFSSHLPATEVIESHYGGKTCTTVVQRRIHGREIKKVDRPEISRLLSARANSANRAFVVELLKYFFASMQSRELYPDIVGCPSDPSFFNSVNLMLDDDTGLLMLCDVGLSPHEDSLNRHGLAFYDGENVKRYIGHMQEFEEMLLRME